MVTLCDPVIKKLIQTVIIEYQQTPKSDLIINGNKIIEFEGIIQK